MEIVRKLVRVLNREKESTERVMKERKDRKGTKRKEVQSVGE